MANLKNLRWQMTKVQNLPVQPKLVPRVLGLKLWHPLNLRKWVRNLAESRGRYTVLCEQFSQAGTVFTCYIYGIHSRLSSKYYKINLTFKSKKFSEEIFLYTGMHHPSLVRQFTFAVEFSHQTRFTYFHIILCFLFRLDKTHDT